MIQRSRFLALILALLLVTTSSSSWGGDDAPRSRASAVTSTGVKALQQSRFDGEDGVHTVYLSDSADPGLNWSQVQPGETRLMLFVHMKAEAGTYAVQKVTGDELTAMFNMGREAPAQSVAAVLFENTSAEPVSVKSLFKEAMAGKHLAHGGAVQVLGAEFKRRLSADFALRFEGAQVAGQARFDSGR